MDRGVKVRLDGTESKAKSVWKTIGLISLSVFLALLTVIVINI